MIRSDDKEVWAASSSRLVADASGRPLQAMAGYDLNERQRERLEIVRRSGETLLHVLNSLLDISKIEAGQLELQEIDFELGDLVRGVVAAFQSDALDRGLSLGLLVEPVAEGGCRGDRGRLLQILHHLLANAMKFTERGSVDLHVARSGDQVKISVRDTGIGIAAESLPRLFPRFEPLDGSTTRRRGGAGPGPGRRHHGGEPQGSGIDLHHRPAPGPQGAEGPPPALETGPSWGGRPFGSSPRRTMGLTNWS